MIAIGSDHGGFRAKESVKLFLLEKEIKYKDFGTYGEDSVDYPEFAVKVSESVANRQTEKGILICKTGIGVSIVANKIKGIRAALCHSEYYAEMARKHNNANVLCLGSFELENEKLFSIVETFLSAQFEGGRHKKRVEKISKIEARI